LGVIGTVSAALGGSPGFPASEFLAYKITDDADDGTEVNEWLWYPDGYAACGRNRMGRAGAERYDIGLRFLLPEVHQGQTFAYARLVLPATGDGRLDSAATLRIVGIDKDDVEAFGSTRPSQLPKTEASVDWIISDDWPGSDGGAGRSEPLLRYSPNIAPIINEIVGRAGWGSCSGVNKVALVIEGPNSGATNYLACNDFEAAFATASPEVQLFSSFWSTLVARELLGRPTDHSVTVNAMSLLTLEVYVEYGTTPGVYVGSTPVLTHAGESPFEITIDDLLPDTQYYYRLRFRLPGDECFDAGPERCFRTQRPPGTTFGFAVQSDSHIWEALRQGTNLELYCQTLEHIAADEPDFLIDLGDTFMCEDYSGGDVHDFDEAVTRHLAQRPYLGLVCHSAPLFFVLGNHEGEQGWRLDGTLHNVAIWATNARKLLYPNPVPDEFYTGCECEHEFVGLRENYYAFEWGDALFVMLDPYWYTTSKPHGAGGSPGSGDNWDWTLGYAQYDWLRQTLENSTATFKFVFSHQVVGGADLYGRGGIEAASHALGGAGSFEWGGEDLTGGYGFDRERPGWGVPIHDLLASNNVTIFFHGHDHVFVKQELDGVVYQECPVPSDAMYGSGHFAYQYGDLVPNSGHLRVTVSPSEVTVDYVRAFLPGDGPDGEIAYSYTVALQGHSPYGQ